MSNPHPPRGMFILYVKDQDRSRRFYRLLLDCEPTLDVPGMVEFPLAGPFTLGLMPSAGIRRLLGESIPDPERGSGIPRAELYLNLADGQGALARLAPLAPPLLSPFAPRPWGDSVAYLLDPDSHVVAIADRGTGLRFRLLDHQREPIPQSILEETCQLDELIFANSNRHIIEEVQRHANVSLAIAHDGDTMVGFKLGYHLKHRHYYSWRGGVHPDYRRRGIASTLMSLQHNFCRAEGYSLVRTQTRNKYREMLLLNIKNGFRIAGTLHDHKGDQKLVLEKDL